MADPFYGEIRMFGFSYAPVDWAYCWGQEVFIQQNPALYSLLGTRFGGNGTTNFKLPDLRSRTVLGAQGTWPDATFAQAAGTESVVLTESNMGPHTHSVNLISPPIVAYETATPSGSTLPIGPVNITTQAAAKAFSTAAAANTTLVGTTVGATAAPTSAHSNLQPYLALNFCICLSGIYPSFN